VIYRVLLIASLLLPGTASLAAMLHANIVDEAGQGIPGANLVVVGSTIGTASDLEGRAYLHNLPPGTHTIEVSCIGYETISVEYTLNAPDILEPVLVLKSTVLDLEEVEVSGQAPDGLDVRGTRTVERISGADLQAAAGGGGALEIIGESSGVDTKPCGLCGSSGVGLQGLDPSYTEVQVDGLALLSGVGSLYGMESIRTQGLAAVELQRGSTNPAQGGSAIAGSVNLQSSQVAETDTLQLHFALGDGYRHETGLTIERHLLLPTRLDLNWSADPLRLDRDGDRLTDTPQQGRLQGRLDQRARIRDSQWNWSLRALDEARFAGDVDWETSDRGSAAVYGRDIRIKRLEAVLHGKWRDGGGRDWKLSQAWVEHRQDSWYGSTAFDAQQQRGLFKLESALNALGGRHRLETGYTWDRYDDNLNLTEATDRLDRIPHFFYGHARQLGSQLAIDGGFRLEYHAEDGLVPLLRGALRWQWHPQFSMQLGAGQAFRQITLFSLDKAVHAGFDGVTLAHALKPERSFALNYALNWEQVGLAARYRLNLGLFATEFRDKAILAYTDENGIVEYSNAQEAWSRGFTLAKDFAWVSGWHSRLNYSWARVRYLQDGSWHEEHMVNRWTASAQLDYAFQAAQASAGLKWKSFGPQKLPAGRSRSESPVWHTLDLTLAKRFLNWQVGFDVENLLDWTQPDSPFIHNEDGELIDSALIYGPLIGRRLRLRLNLGW